VKDVRGRQATFTQSRAPKRTAASTDARRTRGSIAVLVASTLCLLAVLAACSGGQSSGAISATSSNRPTYGQATSAAASLLQTSSGFKSGVFEAAGSTVYADLSRAVQLPDGLVLIVHPDSPPEVYDPVTEVFAPTTLPPIPFGTWVALRDGRFLIVHDSDNGSSLYDPSAKTVTRVESRASTHQFGTTTPLADGRVLLVGGRDDHQYLAIAEIYEPNGGRFVATGSLQAARQNHCATLLADGRVLIAGGDQGDTGSDQLMLSSAETYDPISGKFSRVGSLGTARSRPSCTLLPDGRVLVSGGMGPDGVVLRSAEIFDPATGSFAGTGSMSIPRALAAAVLLRDGRVLVAGGSDQEGPLSSAEVYDPRAGVFAPTGSMLEAGWQLAAITLPNGEVMLFGVNGDGVEFGPERYRP
jgi:hypothetical protein